MPVRTVTMMVTVMTAMMAAVVTAVVTAAVVTAAVMTAVMAAAVMTAMMAAPAVMAALGARQRRVEQSEPERRGRGNGQKSRLTNHRTSPVDPWNLSVRIG